MMGPVAPRSGLPLSKRPGGRFWFRYYTSSDDHVSYGGRASREVRADLEAVRRRREK